MKSSFINYLVRRARAWLLTMLIACCAMPVWSDSVPEYQLKAGFLYNFSTFTEWPAEVGETLNLCVYGQDPFGNYLDELQGKTVGDRALAARRVSNLDRLEGCQIVFIARSASDKLPQVLNKLEGRPVLTVADSPGAIRQGVALNMVIQQNRVTFEANLAAVRGNGLNLSSRLLRLATEVIQ